MYRIHGTNQPEYIEQVISSGCIRTTNEDVIDLVDRVKVGATVFVLAPDQGGVAGQLRAFIELAVVACGSKMPPSRTIPRGACVELKSKIGAIRPDERLLGSHLQTNHASVGKTPH